MLVSDAITKIRAGTLHDADDQISAAQYLALVSDEYRRARRWLCNHAPDLCTHRVSAIAVTGTSITKSSSLTDFEKVVAVRRLEGQTYYPIGHDSSINCVISTGGLEAGTYEVEYLKGAPSSITTGTTIDLPLGLEDVVVERSCAWVRQRHRELDQVAYHERAAERIEKEALSLLKGRGGQHGETGLLRAPISPYVWIETATTIEIRMRLR